MMCKICWRGFDFILIFLFFSLFLYVFFWFWNKKNDNELLKKITILEENIVEKNNIIVAYQRALIGEESDLISMYDRVKQAKQIEFIIHADTESGLPIKFILDCGDNRK